MALPSVGLSPNKGVALVEGRLYVGIKQWATIRSEGVDWFGRVSVAYIFCLAHVSLCVCLYSEWVGGVADWYRVEGCGPR